MYKRIFLNSLQQCVLICALALPGKAQSLDARDSILSHEEIGQASWYGPEHHGKKTATGETFNQYEMTAAHPILPLGTKACRKILAPRWMLRGAKRSIWPSRSTMRASSAKPFPRSRKPIRSLLMPRTN